MKTCLRNWSILLLTFFVISCNRPNDGMVRGRKAITALMDSAESTMDDYPAYADSLMRSIDPSSILTKKQRARYALLYTAAEYKSDQVFTSDSLIMEAVKYYSIRNNIDYRFLSYYYLGCVYLEMKQLTDAFIAYSQAEIFVDRITNDYWKGLLYCRMAYIFGESCDLKSAREYYSMSENCFDRAGKDKHRLYALLYLGNILMHDQKFNDADSIYRLVEAGTSVLGDSKLLNDYLYNRVCYYVYKDEPDSSTYILDKYNLIKDESSSSFGFLGLMAMYYSQIKDFSKSKSYLNAASKCINSVADSIYWYYYNYEISINKGDKEEALLYHVKYSRCQLNDIRFQLNQPIIGVQYDHYRSVAELESIKARNKITILVAFVMIIILIVLSITIYSRNKKREIEYQIQDYISTINDLTTQISVNQDKISILNAKVREMIRNQFNTSDYLYTRYYEQMDDSRKAEHVYRVVRNQLREFTNTKNLQHIDELLDEAFDGIMTKLLSSGLEFKEKDMLLLRFALAGFSAKSIAALLDESHQNINQRKKRMLDRIQIHAPKLMEELRIVLNIKQMSAPLVLSN